MMMRPPIALLAILCLATLAFGEDVVERRGAEPALEGVVVGLTDAAITIRTESGGEHIVPWDHVRDVRMDPPEPTLAARLERAEDLWRARSRLQRGDARLAEDLFVRLFEHYRGQTHETARVVAEGLLRCRIAHGANTAATIPALEVARLHAAGIEIDTYSMLPDVFDERTLLCPHVPPAWVRDRALTRLDRELAAYECDEPVVNELARLYRIAAVRQWDPSAVIADVAPAADR